MFICDYCFVGFVCFVFVCLLVFVCLIMFSCLFDSFAWLVAFHYFLFYNNCRYGKAV